ncbi:DUF1850 domain-containing protein [Halobacillus mangrovi]|uniref:DUF1850 domain-containing protein n=1 Tax=Halobacillus mangrovi TaxID=402384 RepID=A0A1W5ZSX6_9BACI|nr:DUF1850 domain-containing protein [Halobacillus mangrovi]ARI76404.1 hypothetical protein HM131_05940 [Halobacillus mangrovi]
MKLKIIGALTSMLTIGFLLLVVIEVPALTVTSEGETQAFFPYKDGAEFSIRWQHSVEKEDWEEMFVLKNKEIELSGTRFKTFGAGVPNDTGEDTYIKDGWVYMTEINRVIGKQLSIRSGKSTNHRFIYEKDTTLPLKANRSYQLTVKNYSLLYSLKEYITAKMR